MVDPREMPSVNDLEYGESDPLLINEELSPYELLQNNDKDINRSGSVAHEDTLAHEKSGKYPIQYVYGPIQYVYGPSHVWILLIS